MPISNLIPPPLVTTSAAFVKVLVVIFLNPMASAKGKNRAVEIPECPVCLEPMCAPVFLCVSGHSVCAACTRELVPPNCPQCRQPMTQMRNRTFEDIIDKAQVQCPNRSLGCVYTLPAAAVPAHLEECIFRNMECPLGAAFGKCSWTGQLKQIMEHCREKHPREVLAEPEVELADVTLRECDRRVLVAALHKLVFILTVKIDTLQRLAYWSVQHIGPRKKAHQHIYEINLISKQDPQRKVTYIEHCFNDNIKADEIFRQNLCAVVPLDVLNHFVKDDVLTFRYSIKNIANENNPKQERRENENNAGGPHGPRSESTSRARGPGPNGPGANGAGPKGPGPKGPGHKGPGPKGPGHKGPGPKGPGPNGPGKKGPGPKKNAQN